MYIYKVGKLVLINTEVFEQYLETFRIGIKWLQQKRHIFVM
ncbi:MAG: DUF6462 family protein [Coprococcus sp.]